MELNNMKRLAFVLVLICAALFGCTRPRGMTPVRGPFGSTSRQLTGAEKDLQRIVIPDVFFNGANVHDIASYLNEAIRRYGDGHSRVRLLCNVEKDPETWPVITFKANDLSVLEALTLTVELGGLTYHVAEDTVTISRKTGSNKTQEGIGEELAKPSE